MTTAPLPSAEVFIATSVDGYIARRDGSIDWLTSLPVPEGEDFGYAAFMAGIGAIVMGRATFEVACSFPDWPYQVPVVVLTRSPDTLTIPTALRPKVRASSASPREVLQDLGAEGVTCVYIDGGATIRSFLAEGLIRRLTLTRVPVLLGDGLPLFSGGMAETALTIEAAQHWPNGFVQTRYRLGETG